MPSSKVSFSVNLVEAALNEQRFMKEVDQFPGNLYSGPLLSNAFRRYEHMWLPLISTEDPCYIAAPLDVEWVWHLHMLSPRNYASDCKRLVSKIIDHKVLSCEKKKQALVKGAELWKKRYPNEPFNIDIDSMSSISAACSSDLSCDLVRASVCQRSFNYQVSLPHYQDRKFIETAVKRYKKFLELQKKVQNEALVPTQDIDFIWHTHIKHPLAYKNDCMRCLPGSLDHQQEDHSSIDDSTTVCAAMITNEHWLRSNGDTYTLAGTTMRREPPSICTSRHDQKDPYKDLAAPIYTLKLIKAEVCDFPEDYAYNLSLNQSCSTETDKLVAVINGSQYFTEDINGLMSFSSSTMRADEPMMLTVKVTLKDTLKSNSVPLLFFPESLDAVLKENDFTRPKVTKRVFKLFPPGCEDTGKISLTFQILPPLRTGQYTLHVNENVEEFEVPDLSSGVCHPLSVTSRFSRVGPCTVNIFAINSYSGVEAFKCRVVEPIIHEDEGFAVEISQLNGRVIASTHSIAKGEIPFKGQVAKRYEGFPYTNQKNEPRHLIRGRRDWAICYTQTSMSSKIKLYLYLLDEKKRIEISQPSKSTYSFLIDRQLVTVDTMSGDINIPRNLTIIPEILALSFSLKTLKNAIRI